MALFDLPLEALQSYKPPLDMPEDFTNFWESTLTEASSHPLYARFDKVDYGLSTVETFDVTFAGYGGQEVKGWLLLPKVRQGKLPCVVEYIGYGGGCGLPTDWLLWSSAGYAHLIMDTRGQGSAWRRGDTPDLAPEGVNPHVPGFMTQGILEPNTYYYRRVFTDAVRATQAAMSHPEVDASKLAVTGVSQGGGIALAVAGLSPRVAVVMPDVPFLCHYRRATNIVNTMPYSEIANYCKTHRDKIEMVFKTLSYFDGVNFASLGKARALFSVSLMDDICPPSTVFAAYNHFGGDKDIRIWHYNGHEGGGSDQALEKITFLAKKWG